MLAEWVREGAKELRDMQDSHDRLCSTIQIHHENFDQIYERAAQEVKRPSTLSHRVFAEFVVGLTHPEPESR